MDENKKNIRLVRSEGRRVTNTTTEYDWNGLERRMEKERKSMRSSAVRSSAKGQTKRPAAKKRSSALEQRVTYQKKQKLHRVKLQRRRALAVLILAVVAVLVILFLTPLFNIRTINVEGNNFVSQEQLTEVLKPYIGKNLLMAGSGKINRQLRDISYIESAKIEKKLFPPSIKVSVSEYMPAAVLRADGKNLVVTANLHVLSEDGSAPIQIPAVTGIEVENYKTGGDAKLTDAEKKETLITVLNTIVTTEMTEFMIEIDLNDLNNIKINYDNRLTVLCGSQLDIERKLRLFKEAVMSNSLADDARGTMDLSDIGKAVYTP